LADQGFAVYVPHYFERTGTTSAGDKAVIVRHFFAWAKTVWDAVSWVQQQPQVDPERIGLLGFSLGAYLALSVAAVDPRIQAVVEYFGGFPKELKFFMRRFCPILILHGDADTTVPVEEAYHLQQILEKKKIPYEMKIYAGAGHSFSDEVRQDANSRTLAFLEKHLATKELSQTHL
jgi:carboxymethylenebutenolidase